MHYRMEDQKENIQDLHRTIHTLNYKLTNSSYIMKDKSFAPYKNFQGITGASSSSKQETLFTKRNTISQQSLEKYEDISLQFLTDAKSRLGKLRQEEDLVHEKYSFIKALPENDKLTESYFNDFNLVSIPKSSIDNYSFKPFTKPSLTTSILNFENFSRNKIASNLKSPYSLADVKKMVSHSLFSNKDKSSENFYANIGDFDRASWFSNTNDRLKDISKETKAYFDFQKKPTSFSNSETDTFKSSTRNYNRSLFEINSKISDDIYSVGKTAENDTKEVSSMDNKDPGENSNNSNKFLQKIQAVSDAAQNNESESNISSKTCKNVVLQQIEEHEKTSETQDYNFTIQNKTQALQEKSLDSEAEINQKTQSSVLKKSKSNTDQTGIFINLDAAWKQLSPTSPVVSLKVNSQITPKHSSTQDKNLFESVASNERISTVKQDVPTANTENISEAKELSTSKSVGSPLHDDGRVVQNNNNTLTTNADKITEHMMKSKTDSEKSHEFHSDNNNVENMGTMNNMITNVPGLGNEEDKKYVERIESADTLSELSEIQLSCGSEEQQQKEDSDAW